MKKELSDQSYRLAYVPNHSILIPDSSENLHQLLLTQNGLSQPHTIKKFSDGFLNSIKLCENMVVACSSKGQIILSDPSKLNQPELKLNCKFTR